LCFSSESHSPSLKTVTAAALSSKITRFLTNQDVVDADKIALISGVEAADNLQHMSLVILMNGQSVSVPLQRTIGLRKDGVSQRFVPRCIARFLVSISMHRYTREYYSEPPAVLNTDDRRGGESEWLRANTLRRTPPMLPRSFQCCRAVFQVGTTAIPQSSVYRNGK
jgi:hypothetical protein